METTLIEGLAQYGPLGLWTASLLFMNWQLRKDQKEEEFKDFLKAEYKKDWKAAYAWYLEEGDLPNYTRRTL